MVYSNYSILSLKVKNAILAFLQKKAKFQEVYGRLWKKWKMDDAGTALR